MKKWMILAAAILVVLGIGFAVKGASDKKQGATPEGTAVPETTTSAPNEETETANALREETETTETEDGAEEIDTLCGQITEINDEYLILEGTQQGTVQVNIFDDTLYNGSLQQGELAVGQYAEVIYDGKMTRSIPAQIAALAINVYPLKGTVDAVEEDGRVLVTPADGGEQALLVTTEMPQVRGVAVVCEGGDDEIINEKITNAVTAALNITSKRVYIAGGSFNEKR